MNFKASIFLLFLVITCHSLFSQSRRVINKNYKLDTDIGFEYYTGPLLPHHKSLEPLRNGLINAFEVNYKRSTQGNKYWHRYYDNPTIGYALLFANFNENKVLGSAISASSFLRFNLIDSKWQTTQFKVSSGLAYITKVYDSTKNRENIAISSHFNLAINIGISSKINLTRKTYISLGLCALHYSNGSIKKPNYGLNFILGNFSYNHSFGSYKKGPKPEPNKNTKENATYSIIFVGGIKEAGDPGGPKYFVQSLSFSYLKTYQNLLHYGVGFDVMHDASAFVHIRQDSLPRYSMINEFKIGIPIQGEMSLDKFSFFGDFGVYLYNKDPHVGLLYQRIGVKYSIFSFLKLQLALKTHLNVADYIEFGLTYKFKSTQTQFHNKWKAWYDS